MSGKFRSESCQRCGTPCVVVDGHWLTKQRKAAGVTLRGMADRLGFSAAYLCDVEKNRRNCSPKIRLAYEELAS